MKELILTGKDEWIVRLKAHLEKEHPSTRGKMLIKDKIEYKRNIGFNKKDALKAGFKQSFKNIGDATKKALDPIDKVMMDIDKQIKGFG